MKEIEINSEYIKLNQLLKLTGEADTGGQASLMIKEGKVKVNGEVRTERGKKIRKGDIVEIEGKNSYKMI